MADHELIDMSDVHSGPVAALALIGAFLNAPSDFHVEVTFGVQSTRPDEVLVMVELIGIRTVFTPDELLRVGRSIIAGIPAARACGAKIDADELRKFASMLIRNAEDAAAISPHGLN